MAYDPNDFEASGTPIGIFGSNCGKAIGTGDGPKSDGGCLNSIQFQHAVPYGIKYLKDACPP